MKAAIIGATGLVGQRLLRLLLDSDRYSEIHAIGRRKIDLDNPKLTQHIIGLDNLAGLSINADIDHAFCTLGTTIKQAGSPEEFQRVDRDYVCVFGELMKRLGASGLAVNSSIGADSGSANLYLRTKGEMEDCLRRCQFGTLVVVRPSLLVPTGRQEFRLGEVVAFGFFRVFGWLMQGPLRRYRPVDPRAVARALFDGVQSPNAGIVIVQSEAVARG
ncbi:MAG: hypothetical protein AMJ68_05695 [Acidithiobacillales bacterium SG8_45]|jgi:uncharacterized protein YbjT (DUF2867 family)|nr:MAG: hypothetical protein AMJ68_05695 [Acidithiobacillales bacterium SG8_45]